MKIVLVVVLVAHAVAHLVGFVVPWRLLSSAELPYKTTILAGGVDLGDGGIRLVGLLWLAAAAAFGLAAAAFALKAPWAVNFAFVVAVMSMALCLAEWPQARIGAFVNAALLGLFTFGLPWSAG